ncbi:MAG: hypothetical protein OXC00_11740, partial [Acidimicrobiaceae bacterium]|nr:hypothetical protein [Acidimicrobiaceae bacterium]
MSTTDTPLDGAESAPAPRSLPPVRVIRSPKRKKTVSARMSEGVLVVRVPAWTTEDEEEALVSKGLARFEE